MVWRDSPDFQWYTFSPNITAYLYTSKNHICVIFNWAKKCKTFSSKLSQMGQVTEHDFQGNNIGTVLIVSVLHCCRFLSATAVQPVSQGQEILIFNVTWQLLTSPWKCHSLCTRRGSEACMQAGRQDFQRSLPTSYKKTQWTSWQEIRSHSSSHWFYFCPWSFCLGTEIYLK